MASVTIVLKKNKPLANGDFPLYLRIIKNRKSVFESLNINVSEALWDDKNKRVKGKYPNSARVNNTLAKKIAEANAKVLELDGKAGGVKQIKKELSQKITSSVIMYFQEYLDDLKKADSAGTLRKSRSIMKKFVDYQKGNDINFDEFTLDYLKGYEKHLRKLGNTTNTVHANLKVFRMLFNKAVAEDLILIQNNPFVKFKLKWDNVEKTYLTETEIKEFEAVKVTAGTVMEKHRDLFVFACYAGGIRVSDLLQLRWENYDSKEQKVSFFIQKTKQNHSVKLPDKAIEIINKYKPKEAKKGYIFNLIPEDTYGGSANLLLQKISSATAYINKNLKTLAKKANIERNISFHTSRHTFGTLAIYKGMRIVYVSKIMAHSNLATTMIYSKINDEDTDKMTDLMNK